MNFKNIKYTSKIIWKALEDVEPFSLWSITREAQLDLNKRMFITGHACDRFKERFFIKDFFSNKKLAMYILRNIKQVYLLNSKSHEFENEHYKAFVKIGEIDGVIIILNKSDKLVLKTIWIDNQTDNFSDALKKSIKNEMEFKDLDQRLKEQFFKNEEEFIEFNRSTEHQKSNFINEKITKKIQNDRKTITFDQIMQNNKLNNQTIEFAPVFENYEEKESSFEDEIADLFKDMD